MWARVRAPRCLLLLATALLVAQDARAAGPAQADVSTDECTCRGSDGRQYLLGERVCLRTSAGPRIAECAMVLNNTSWRLSDRACPES